MLDDIGGAEDQKVDVFTGSYLEHHSFPFQSHWLQHHVVVVVGSTCQGHLPWRAPSAIQIDPSKGGGSNRETAADVISVHGFADVFAIFVVFCGGCFLVEDKIR